MNFPHSAVAIELTISNLQVVFSAELIFDRVELINGSFVEGVYNCSLFRVSRLNRTTYVINYDAMQLMEFDKNVKMETAIYYNRFNNNQYTLSPIQTKKGSLCDTMKKYSRLFFNVAQRHTTNMADPNVFYPLKKVLFHCLFHFLIRICFDFRS